MTIEVGARAPEFAALDLDGEIYRLSEALAQGPVLLVFFKTTCGTCSLAFPYLNRLWKSYAGGWSLWAVAQDPLEAARKYVRQHDMTYPVLPDVDGYPVSKAYDPPATPTLFLIDSEGRVVEQSAGFDKGELNSLSAALAERLGAEAVVVAPGDDGNPDFRPG